LFPFVPLVRYRLPELHEPSLPRPALLETCPRESQHSIRTELDTIKELAATGIAHSRRNSIGTTWDIWETFCAQLHCDPYLAGIDDPIPLLQIFAHRYRIGTVAPSGASVRSRTVEGALRAVGQTLASLGSDDPRVTANGKLDLRLTRQLAAYKKQDPPPTRVKPIPFPILAQTAALCRCANTAASNTIADMLLLGFFFLLRPGEYAYTDNPDAAPFRLCDIHLLIHNRRINPLTSTIADLRQVNYVALEFTTQKNGVRGELVGLGRTGHPIHCPVHALVNRIHHFRTNNAPMTTPLYSYFHNTWKRIDTATLTSHLRITVTAMGSTYGINPTEISVRSLRSSGAMALLCAKVDSDTIRLLGRWRSDEMLRYLHVQTFPLVAPLAAKMLRHGHFTLIPNHNGE
jgi:hypothetical protein